MTVASAYTLEEVVKLLDGAYAAFMDGEERYPEAVEEVLGKLEGVAKKYPDDGELGAYLGSFKAFVKKREAGMAREEEKKELSALVSDLKHQVHWRKLGMSSGKDLPYKDYRSLRGEIGRRGL